jgi:hypothetical protein
MRVSQCTYSNEGQYNRRGCPVTAELKFMAPRHDAKRQDTLAGYGSHPAFLVVRIT